MTGPPASPGPALHLPAHLGSCALAVPAGGPVAIDLTKRVAGDGGQTAAIPAMVVLIMVLVTLVIQTALVQHARTVVDAAAADGLAAAQTDEGSSYDGEQAAERTLAGSRERLLTDVTITVDRNQNTTTVTVTGTVIRLVPFANPNIRSQVTGITERFRPSTDP